MDAHVGIIDMYNYMKNHNYVNDKLDASLKKATQIAVCQWFRLWLVDHLLVVQRLEHLEKQTIHNCWTWTQEHLFLVK